MIQIQFSEQSISDLVHIFQFSTVTFGKNVAYKYIQGLQNTTLLLRTNPKIGKHLLIIDTNYYRLQYKQHSIFYTYQNNRITIVRIIHNNSDYLRWL
jgi:toxin ParE1/3/4